jgi:N-glycosylase/DNA lyase
MSGSPLARTGRHHRTTSVVPAPDESVLREWRTAWQQRREDIEARLAAFRAVPRDRWFHELCFCLMTPQSSAVQCDAVARELEHRDFRARAFDPAPLLRSHEGGYVRFHNVKARRLLALRAQFAEIDDLIATTADDRALRDMLAARVDGLGLKEAGHFLRNIGRTGAVILDRHILRALLRAGMIDALPASIGPARYADLERRFDCLAMAAGIPAEALDLLLWSEATGFILK